MRSVNSHEFDLLYCDRSLFTLYYTADNVNFKSKVIYGHVHVSHGRKGHHMVYDNAFHMYFAKQEAIIQYKERCSSSLTTIFFLFNSAQDRAVVRVGDCTCLEPVMLSWQAAAACPQYAVSQSVTAAVHMLQQYSAYRD